LDCQAEQDQFLVVQWWHSRTTSEQQQAIVDLTNVYQCFTVSNEMVSNAKQQLIQKSLEQNEETEQVASGKQTGEHFFSTESNGLFCALQKTGMEHTASAKVAAPKKKQRHHNMLASSQHQSLLWSCFAFDPSVARREN
jgi:hypothetical protein